MKGKFKKKTGKISVVDLKKRKAAIEGIQTKKKDGTKINIWFDASNLQIQDLYLDDKKRFKRKKRTEKNKPFEKVSKPSQESKQEKIERKSGEK